MTEYGDGPPAAKRARYNLRKSAKISPPIPLASPSQTHRYMLRSSIGKSNVDFECNELPQPKRKRPAQSLMVLNDDCLLKILEFLQPINLHNIFQVNVRLNDLIEYHVRLKYKIERRTTFDFSTVDGQLISKEAARLYLTFFGHQIQSLEVRSQSVFEVLAAVIFEQLSSSINRSSLNFPQLHDLRIKNVDISNDFLLNLLDHIPTLRTLSVVNCSRTSSYFFKAIPKLQNLEEFEFRKWRQSRQSEITQDLTYLLRLKKLKVLKFGFAAAKFSVLGLLEGFAENCIAIEHLELENCHIDDESAEVIGKLKSMKILKLNTTGLCDAHVVHIAKELKFLEELHVRTDAVCSQNCIKEILNAAVRLKCFKIDANGVTLDPVNYRDILTIVQGRPGKNKLDLWIYGDGSPLLFPYHTRNEQWLVVKQLNRNSSQLFEVLPNRQQ